MRNVESLVNERALAKNLRVELDVEQPPCPLIGDPTRLQQALLNYATNAVKFTESGTVKIRCRVVEETGEDVMMRFEVEDTGIGIPPEADGPDMKAGDLAASADRPSGPRLVEAADTKPPWSSDPELGGAEL
jgi:hypothetical protein